jgi:hypothetical protein
MNYGSPEAVPWWLARWSLSHATFWAGSQSVKAQVRIDELDGRYAATQYSLEILVHAVNGPVAPRE